MDRPSAASDAVSQRAKRAIVFVTPVISTADHVRHVHTAPDSLPLRLPQCGSAGSSRGRIAVKVRGRGHQQIEGPRASAENLRVRSVVIRVYAARHPGQPDGARAILPSLLCGPMRKRRDSADR